MKINQFNENSYTLQFHCENVYWKSLKRKKARTYKSPFVAQLFFGLSLSNYSPQPLHHYPLLENFWAWEVKMKIIFPPDLRVTFHSTDFRFPHLPSNTNSANSPSNWYLFSSSFSRFPFKKKMLLLLISSFLHFLTFAKEGVKQLSFFFSAWKIVKNCRQMIFLRFFSLHFREYLYSFFFTEKKRTFHSLSFLRTWARP